MNSLAAPATASTMRTIAASTCACATLSATLIGMNAPLPRVITQLQRFGMLGHGARSFTGTNPKGTMLRIWKNWVMLVVTVSTPMPHGEGGVPVSKYRL